MFILLFILDLTDATFGSMKGDSMKDHTRMPSVAGQFYPKDPSVLRSTIEEMLSAPSNKRITGRIKALLAPHAGYIYSGEVAAAAYRLLEPGNYKTVIVISPCHVEHFRYASIFSGRSYLTPLGEIPVDRELAEKIASFGSMVKLDDAGHISAPGRRGEHSLEVQLPFLQVVLGDFKLVPIVMGDQSDDIIESLGGAIGQAVKGEDVLIVASTDLSHFHPRDNAKRLDDIFIQALKKFDHEDLAGILASGKTEACGGGPVATAILASRSAGADRCEVIEYADSGDKSGDYSSVVGYLSAVFIDDDGKKIRSEKNSGTGVEKKDSGKESDLTREDKLFLLKYARQVIENRLNGKETVVELPPSAVLGEKRGGFVTLKINNQLRGCIGYIEAIKPLADTVAEMAESAAFNDYRFRPVVQGELDDIAIEISVLSPVRKAQKISKIIVGRHGIIITRGRNRGLLLPQVATEWNWDRETFLSQTCVKAGLDQDAWKKEGTVIEIFSAEIFSEKEMGLR